MYLTDPRALQHPLARAAARGQAGGRLVRLRPMRALITGGGGQLASDLAALLGRRRARRSATASWTSPTSTRSTRAFAEVEPDVVFNCAAFHNVDVCEAERERAWQVNVEAVRELALRSPLLVHVSTNYVFDGRRPEPYAETDLPSPRSVYALTKLAGEHAALAYAPQRAGRAHRRPLRAARQREQGRQLRAADDRARARAGRAADGRRPATPADVHRRSRGRDRRRRRAGADGLVHLTAVGACSWHEFTVAIMDRAGIDVPIEPVRPTIAARRRRPSAERRACPSARRRARPPALRPWEEALADYMERARLIEPRIADSDDEEHDEDDFRPGWTARY